MTIGIRPDRTGKNDLTGGFFPASAAPAISPGNLPILPETGSSQLIQTET